MPRRQTKYVSHDWYNDIAFAVSPIGAVGIFQVVVSYNATVTKPDVLTRLVRVVVILQFFVVLPRIEALG